MARGKQLLQLVTMLREEVGRATSVAVGVEDLPGLKQKLRRTQETLYDKYDWPFLQQMFDPIPLEAGDRYYDMPAGLNLDRIKDEEGVVIWYNNWPRPIDRGIDWSHYAQYNPQNDVRVDPVLRWDVRWTGTEAQIEVWPIPVTNTMTLQFRGIRNLRAMVGDADVADLDDQLIVLFTAAEILAMQGAESAKAVAAIAQARFDSLKNLSASGRQKYRIGMGPARSAKPSIVVRAN